MKIAALIITILFSAVIISAQESEVLGKAPNFILEDMNGDEAEFTDFLGEGPVLISFWATWCKPCKEEMPHLQKIYDEFKSKGFKFIAIATDAERSVSKVKPYIRSHGYTFDVLLDTNSEVARLFYARAVPFSIVTDKNGNIVYQHLGYRKGDELEVRKVIEKLITQE